MTLPEAEAIYHLAVYSYAIAGHGERDSMRKWKSAALHRLMLLENIAARVALAAVIETRAP